MSRCFPILIMLIAAFRLFYTSLWQNANGTSRPSRLQTETQHNPCTLLSLHFSLSWPCVSGISATQSPVSTIWKAGDWSDIPERLFRLKLAETSDTHEPDERDGQRQPAHAVEPPTLFNPFKDPRLNARPCDRLRIRTKPVMGPSSPSFSMLRLANASSPVKVISIQPVVYRSGVTYQKHSEHRDSRSRIDSRPSLMLLASDMSCSCMPLIASGIPAMSWPSN